MGAILGMENLEVVEYKEQIVKDYKGNPFIEALPHIYSQDERIRLLNEYPYYDESERTFPIEDRLHCVQQVLQCFQLLEFHEEIEEKISTIIRQGYVNRNPLEPEYAKRLNMGFESISRQDIAIYNTNNIRRNTSYGLSIIGISGIGKTSIVNKILSLYPQVINHSSYKGKPLVLSQLTWLKLDCPFDGSIKGLCIDFFFNVDRVLGTNYYKKYGGHRARSVNMMMPIIAQIAQNHGLGVLIIDEIQHLNIAKSGGREKMLNFFVTLINMIGIPVILIGTPKALPILQYEFRQARRGSGQGDIIIDRLKKDDDWEMLLNAIFKYQWTNKPFKLTRDLSDAIYEESMGIIDIAVKLYIMTQKRAIKNDEDIITPEMIKEVSKEDFKLIKPMIDSLKSIHKEDIESFEDVLIDNIDNLVKENLENNKKINIVDGNDLRKITEGSESSYDSLKLNGYIKS